MVGGWGGDGKVLGSIPCVCVCVCIEREREREQSPTRKGEKSSYGCSYRHVLNLIGVYNVICCKKMIYSLFN